jgi:uncharacterized protein with PQ loop repeat
MELSKYEWIDDLALSLNVLAMIPQLYHTYNNKDAKSLSYIFL